MIPEGSGHESAAERHLRNLAESHAREADRLARDSRDAPLVHAHLAIAYAILAGQEPRP